MQNEEEKHVFICHNSKDKPFVRSLAQGLAKHKISSWVDEAEIRSGESLWGRIAPAIESISLVIAVISKNSANSSWVKYELDLAMTKEISNDRVVVIPVVVDKSDIPFGLTHKKYADFSDTHAFDEEMARLANDIRYYTRNSPRSIDGPIPGESITATITPTLRPFLLPSSIITLCVVMILIVFVASRGDSETSPFGTLVKYVYLAFLSGIVSQIIEIYRLLLFQILIRTNPNFAQDASNIHVTFLWSANYRRFISKYRKFHLLKVAVVAEGIEGVFLVALLYFVLKVLSMA